MADFDWFVPGEPKPQGSMTPMRSASTGKTFVKQPKGMLAWRKWVMEITQHGRPKPPLEGAAISLHFWLPRPKSHPKYTHASPWSFKKPDIDKLARAVLDALTYAQVLQDDAVVVQLCLRKRYAHADQQPGVHIYVDRVDPPTNPRKSK